jgi:hypothetical protein
MKDGTAKGDATLWAIDLAWLNERSNELLRQHDKDCPGSSDDPAVSDYINRILLRRDNAYVIVRASPRELNERMLTQQGELLCNLRHGTAFSTVLLGMLIHPSKVERQVVSRIVVSRENRIDFLRELRRMNIHEASLFPGLDGFAKSLGVNLDILVDEQVQVRKQAFLEYLKSKGG